MKTIHDEWQMEQGFGFFLEEFVYTQDTVMKDAHFHNYLEITGVKGGKIVYRFGEREVEAGDGDTVIVNHLEPHAVRGTHERAQVTVIGFRPEFVWRGADEVDYRYIENFFNSEEVFANLVPSSAEYGKEIAGLTGEITAEYRRREDGYKLMIKAKLLQLLTLLYRHHPRVSAGDRYRHFEKLKAAVDYVGENFARCLTLAECADVAGYSPAYFSVVFHRVLGERFCDYLSKVRVEKCCELLSGSRLTVKEIGRRCGFANPANFLTIFRRLKGVTPLQYRKNQKK